MTNGLLKRVFRIAPSVTCVDFVNLSSGQQLLHAVAPEARLVLNAKTYHIGGLLGQTEKAYLLPECPDGRDWDGILHVDPSLTTRGFVLLYNPLKTPITRTIQVPLYYTGLSEKAVFYNEKGEKIVNIDRDYNASITVDIPAGGWVWYAILR